MSQTSELGLCLTERLWTVAQHVQFPETEGQLMHIRGVLNAAELAMIDLSFREREVEGQQITLIDDRDFDRSARNPEEAAAAYASRPRTKVYENIAHSNEGAIRETCVALGVFTERVVTCSAYESHTGDGSIFRHYDEWFGIVLQKDGTKLWDVEPDGQGRFEVLTRPGDVLVLPTFVRHSVSTPVEPGYSLHLNFAFHAKLPLAVLTGH